MSCNIFYVRLLIIATRMCWMHVCIWKINLTLMFATRRERKQGSLSNAISKAGFSTLQRAAGDKITNIPVRRWHRPLQLFLGKDMHSPHVVFFNAQHTFPSDPSLHLSAQFHCSVVGFILCFSLYYFNDPLTESDWKNPINVSDTVGDVDGHKSACSLARNSSRGSQGKANSFKIWPTKTRRGLERRPTKAGIGEAPQIVSLVQLIDCFQQLF